MPQLPEQQPTLVLCDFAEVVNGKLYIMGGGFDQVRAEMPVPLSLALIWLLPWERANHRQSVEFRLVTEDGEPFNDTAGQPVKIEAQMEVGRPPGVKPGAPLGAPLAIKLPPLVFAIGSYRWEFYINGSLEATVAFHAIGT